MTMVDYNKRVITCKIVYYGTGLGGKTTNLKYIHSQIAPEGRGEMTSLQTQTDRTLFFDFLPVNLGTVNGFKVRFALYTVPGQIEYNASRRLILNGVDGIVFVADSDQNRAVENAESFNNMIENLATYHLTMGNVPCVLQYNKRDLTDAMTVQVMEKELNVLRLPSFEAIATEGGGVVQTMKAITKLVLDQVSKEM